MRLMMASTISTTLEGFLLPFAEHFRSKGWQVDAVANGAASSDVCRRSFDAVWNIGWTRHPLDLGNLVRPVREVERLVRERRYDIVHVHTPVAAFVLRYALRRLRKQASGPKVIYTAHGFHFYKDGDRLRNRRFLWLEQLAGRWTDYLIVINQEDEALAKEYHVVPEDRVFYMPGIGVDVERYSPERVNGQAVAAVRAELGLGEEDRLFLMIAEFNAGKRHRDALAALASLSTRANTGAGVGGIHLAFAGEGPLVEATMNLARRLGVERHCHFLGFRKDIPTLIRASVATLLPSEREGLPRSVMESLCLGVPVIGTDVRGIRELLGGAVGLIVPVGSPTRLAGAMAWILDHPCAAQEMGQRGRARMTAYDVNRITALHEELYARALQAKPRFVPSDVFCRVP